MHTCKYTITEGTCKKTNTEAEQTNKPTINISNKQLSGFHGYIIMLIAQVRQS